MHDFHLTDDAIVHHLLSHRIFVAFRPHGSDGYATVGVLDWQQHTIAVPAAGATTEHGFAAAIRLGIQHIAEGADHLLFLIMLLLPAPLLARHGRWVRADDLRRNCRRVVHVVTAFALGHSITLALAALGYISVSPRLVESLIALSILVSGVHALRPLVPGGEAWIAAGFGLMHGLAFAALLGDLDLGRNSLVADLLGFNLGIELTQLMVVALLMPSLLILSQTRIYPAARLTIATIGIALATAWLAERTTLIPNNPLNHLTDTLITHPFAVAGTLAAIAAITWAVPNLRTAEPRRARRTGPLGKPGTEGRKRRGSQRPQSALSSADLHSWVPDSAVEPDQEACDVQSRHQVVDEKTVVQCPLRAPVSDEEDRVIHGVTEEQKRLDHDETGSVIARMATNQDPTISPDSLRGELRQLADIHELIGRQRPVRHLTAMMGNRLGRAMPVPAVQADDDTKLTSHDYGDSLTR